MIRKNKVVDIILFGGDINLLEMRFLELSDYVDHFIIVESIPEIEKNKFNYDYRLVSKWLLNTKIYTTSVDLNSTDQEPNLNSLLEQIIFDLDLNFTDVIMLSKYNEIPDMSMFDEIYKNLDFGPIIFKSPSLVWNINYMEKNDKFGTFVFLFTHLITKEVNFLTLFRDKSNIVVPKYSKAYGGWILEGFESNKEINPFLIENYLPNTNIDPYKTYQLILRTPEVKLPKHIFKLKNKTVGRNHSKVHFFDCDNSNNSVDQFDTNIQINFSDNPIENVEYDSNMMKFKINSFLPKNVLYGDKSYEEFIIDYKFNEVIKFCSTVFPLDQDKIIIKLNGVIKEFLWVELKKNPLN